MTCFHILLNFVECLLIFILSYTTVIFLKSGFYLMDAVNLYMSGKRVVCRMCAGPDRPGFEF